MASEELIASARPIVFDPGSSSGATCKRTDESRASIAKTTRKDAGRGCRDE